MRGLLLLIAVGMVTGCGCGRTNITGETDASDEESADPGPDTSVPDLEPEEPSPECGNGILEEGEVCDGGESACDSHDGCPGTMTCLPDCTWSECVGFGIITGPVVITEDEACTYIDMVNLHWTGENYVVVYSGGIDDESFSGPAVHFTPLDIHGEVDGTPRFVFPDTVLGTKVDTSWRAETSQIGLVLSGLHSEDPLQLNVLDSDGMPTIEPNAEIAVDRMDGAQIAAGSDGYGAVWFDTEYPEKVHFAALDGEMSIHSVQDIVGLGSYTYRVPGIMAEPGGYLVYYHVERGSTRTSHVDFQHFSSTGELLSETFRLDEEEVDDAEPPFLLIAAEGVYGLVFGRQVDPVTGRDEFFFAIMSPEGRLLSTPVGIGSLMNWHDNSARITWTGEEFGVVAGRSLGDEYMNPSEFVFHRFGISGAESIPEFETGIEGVLSLPAVAWDGSGYGVVYKRRLEDGLPEPPFEQLEFIRLGCTTSG